MHYSSNSCKLLPKIDEVQVQDEAKAQLTYESVPEHEAPSDPVPNAVYTAKDVGNLQKQLPEAREELNAKDQLSRYCDKSSKYVLTFKNI